MVIIRNVERQTCCSLFGLLQGASPVNEQQFRCPKWQKWHPSSVLTPSPLCFCQMQKHAILWYFVLMSYAAIWVAFHSKWIPSVTRFNKSSLTQHESQSSNLNWTSTPAPDELFFSWYLTSSFFPLSTFYSPHAATIHVYYVLLYAGWGTSSCGPDCNREWFRQRCGLTSRGDGYRHL